jgi:hypothetical protein
VPAAPAVARQIGVTPDEVGFFSAWTSAPWQVVLGQVGFFDQFTVTFSRQALRLAVEPVEAFDARLDSA